MPDAPHEVLLMLDANQGQNALAQAQQFHAALGVTGLVLTKLDGTARGGIVVAIARQLGIPIRFIGMGEKAEDFGVHSARQRVRQGAAMPMGAGRQRGARRDPFRARQQALSERARGTIGAQLRGRRRRDGLSDRPLRRRQKHSAQADRTARAPHPRAGDGRRRRTPRNCRATHAAGFVAASASCSRIIDC